MSEEYGPGSSPKAGLNALKNQLAGNNEASAPTLSPVSGLHSAIRGDKFKQQKQVSLSRILSTQEKEAGYERQLKVREKQIVSLEQEVGQLRAKLALAEEESSRV